ncbi:hypothetical protein [Conexibacter woesei]|uniref:hypothetical protein n=1 Tax=Conexibacter woesei TaxID=191495 RepID=UPI00041D1C2D|nr:hypothetical protein [Conexibacter woesei]
MASAATIHQRRLVAMSVLGAVAAAALVGGAIAGAGGGGGAQSSAAEKRVASSDNRPKPAQLPGGGRRLFPERRVVAFYGNPRDRELGELGIGTPAQAARKLLKQAQPYNRRSRPVLPAMELITTVATAAPGPTGEYRDRMSFNMIRRYHAAAKKAGALLVLDIQPGRGSFAPEVERLRPFLVQPDVGLALDPEWHVAPGQLPGKVIGQTDADVVNASAMYLSKLVKTYNLPERLLIVHRFTDNMITRAQRLRQAPGVRTVINVDGFGTNSVKIAKYQSFVRTTPTMNRGFKLFYHEDPHTMRPYQVMAMSPRPDVVVYE